MLVCKRCKVKVRTKKWYPFGRNSRPRKYYVCPTHGILISSEVLHVKSLQVI